LPIYFFRGGSVWLKDNEARQSDYKESMKNKGNVEAITLYSRPESSDTMADFGMDVYEYMKEMPRRRLAELPLGGSRFGGLPDLPASMTWPSWDGKMLPFLAQIDLAVLPRSPLPSEGWLYVFCLFGDHATRMEVLYHRGSSAGLVRAERPGEDEVWKDWTYNSIYDVVPLVAGIKPDEGKWEEAGWFFGEIDENGERAEDLASNAELPGDDWITLLVIGSVGGMEWGDGSQSKAQFVIRQSDLAKLDFARVHGACCCSG
jgi:hypothetical protein